MARTIWQVLGDPDAAAWVALLIAAAAFVVAAVGVWAVDGIRAARRWRARRAFRAWTREQADGTQRWPPMSGGGAAV